MKLLMITGDRALAEGKHGAFYNTIEEFHKYWDRIDIICPRITNYELRITNLFGNVYLHTSPWPLILHPLWIWKIGREIYKEQKFGLMTVHEYPPFYNGIGARLLWNKIKVPYVMEIFHIPGYPKSSNAKEEIYKQLVKVFLKYDSSRAKIIRVMNGKVGRFIEDCGILREKIKLIPAIYIDLEIFKPMNLSKEYDLIFIGRLEPNKGINLFIEAVEKMGGNGIIIGDGSLKDEINSKIKNSKLKINLYGYAKDQNEIARLINKSKILVMPSYNEGGPRVVVEALACGVPVIATPVGIVSEIIKENLGQITDWDADDISKKAKSILDNYDNYRNSGLEIVRKFDKKTVIKNYYEAVNYYTKS